MNENDIRLKEKIDFFMQEKVLVHVKLLDKTFLNGYIDKEIRSNVYWFKERKLGEVYLFLKDVYEIEVYNPRENNTLAAKDDAAKDGGKGVDKND